MMNTGVGDWVEVPGTVCNKFFIRKRVQVWVEGARKSIIPPQGLQHYKVANFAKLANGKSIVSCCHDENLLRGWVGEREEGEREY